MMTNSSKLYRVLAIIAASAVMMAAGCGDDDGGGSSSPEGKCNALAKKICGRVWNCDGDYSSVGACEADAKAGINCRNAVDVDSSYDQCMSDVGKLTCPWSLPSSCFGVILTK